MRIDIEESRRAGLRSSCNSSGCMNMTSGNKPFCPDHVYGNPYVVEVSEIIAARDSELEAVAMDGWAAVADGIVVNEVLTKIRELEAASVSRIAGELMLPIATVLHYVTFMESKGLAEVVRVKKKTVVVAKENPNV